MISSPVFGPGGNSLSFYSAGYKHTYQAPQYCSDMKLGAYEYQAGNGVSGSEDTFRKIGEQASRYGIAMSLHAPYYISLSGTETEKRLKSIDYIKQSINAATLIGADLIVIHAGSASKITRAEALALASDTLYKALEETDGCKIKFGIETMGKQNQLGTLEEVLELCSIDGRLCPVVDFGHLNARNNGGLFGSPDGYRRVFDTISHKLGAVFAKHLHCHFSKIEYTAAGEKKHLTFSDTQYGPDFEPLAKAIVLDGLCPRIICESDGTMAEDALAMKKMYEAAAAEGSADE